MYVRYVLATVENVWLRCVIHVTVFILYLLLSLCLRGVHVCKRHDIIGGMAPFHAQVVVGFHTR